MKDVAELLEAASLLVPEEIATEDDVTVHDVWEYLVRDEWDVALGLLEELGGVRPQPPAFWETLAGVAEQLRLERSAAWCRWRCSETRNGVIRADLTLRPGAEGRRRTPLSGAGLLRPMWDIGHRTPTGEPALAIARLWVEYPHSLEPGGQATVRLAPLDPARWRHLRPGQVIALHEDRSVADTAVVREVRPSGVASG
ncbi:hypothetical protein [Streptomyces camelliae]|uniref:Uncharacterized protein n=1 Tax=Streptomyces camelliae TaxID=3004093 RepID=A0ABY7NZA6_9ACTN|nr:hypothetical protein [Streptomyces sp. HUAS 2-6]WBO61916.1 hypothetical protein O1G22_03210 [Streptomyces sp. HUAS 2-6]